MQGTIKKNAILNTIRTIAGIVFPLITFPYVSRVLTVDELGKYEFGHSFVSYFLLLAGLGVSTYAIREGTTRRDNQEKINSFVSEVFTINILSMLISYLLLTATLFLIPRLFPYRIVIMLFSVQIVLVTIGVFWIFNIYEDFLFLTIRSIAFQLFAIVLMLALIRKPGDLYKYTLITVFANAGPNIWSIFRVKKYCQIHIVYDLKRLTVHLKPIFIIFATAIAVTIYVNSDITMLGIMTNNYVCGIYGFSARIYTVFKNILVAVVTVLIPRFSLYAASGELDKHRELFQRAVGVLSLVVFPAVTGLISLCDDVVVLVGGEKYEPSSPSLRILAIAAIFSLFAYLFIYCILIPFGRENTVFLVTTVGALVNIALNIALIPRLLDRATAITTLISEFVVMCIAIIVSRKTISVSIKKSDIYAVLLGCAMIAVVCCLMSQLVDIFIVRIIVSIVLGLVIYIFTVLIFKNTSALYFVNLLLCKLEN